MDLCLITAVVIMPLALLRDVSGKCCRLSLVRFTARDIVCCLQACATLPSSPSAPWSALIH